ncbi:ACP S-malonyltransferase [Streptomyces sp. SID12501]|uniref:Acyltransferase domain-containing protein n=1 Tax=Streptomyces sp. SID12501 TaxID=2706042 RepID=A0A6B3BU55_9ACTN|nr:acyltransferase domain-containing protein [Streptomyces sp. SID12501]NEC87828.1 acyltransferase domain-containing protein [Streptomyces sp. SID12501]
MHISPARRPDRPSDWRRSVHLFPGQGDFSVSSLVRAARADGGVLAAVRQVFQEIDDIAVGLGLPPLGPWLLGANPPSGRDLAQAATGATQLALFGASVAVHQALCDAYGAPSAVVGVSFGEIAALTAAGVLTIHDGARAAHDLSLVLASCPGGLTLLSCPEPSARRLLEQAGAADARVAVVNDDRSVVVAGPVPDLVRVEKTAADSDVASARLRLPFSSHHPSFASQAEVFAASLRARTWSEARFPVYSAVAGRRYRPDDDLARRLADCLVRPAAVPAVLRQAARHRPDVLFEAGTGDALASSARRVLSADTAPPVHAPLAETDFPW